MYTYSICIKEHLVQALSSQARVHDTQSPFCLSSLGLIMTSDYYDQCQFYGGPIHYPGSSGAYGYSGHDSYEGVGRRADSKC